MKIQKNKYLWMLFFVLIMLFISKKPYLMFLGTFATINAIAVLGINIISGYTGQLHLGQAAFMGLGAYSSALIVIRLNIPFWFSLPLGIIISALFGVLLGIPALKLKGGPYLALVTQTFGEIVFLIFLNLESLTGGPFGLSGIRPPRIGSFEFTGIQSYFILCIVFLVISFIICYQIVNSRFGRAFISIRESEAASQSIAINTTKYKILAFSIAAAFGGVAGALYGPFMGYISPDQFRWVSSLSLISMAIVGGLGNITGGVIGAYVVTFLPELLRVAEEYRLILYGLLLIFTLAFLPNGLISLFEMNPKQIILLFKERIKRLLNKTKQTENI